MTDKHLHFTDNEMYQTEGQLQQMHQLIFENTHDLIAVYTLPGFSCKYFNSTTTNLLGYTKEELFDMGITDPIHPEDRIQIQKNLNTIHLTKYFKNELRYIKKDGIEIWLEVNGAALSQGNGDGVLILTSRDISEYKKNKEDLIKSQEKLELLVEKRTEQLQKVNRELESKINQLNKTEMALNESENYYRTIFENTGAATMIIEDDMTISMANEKCAELILIPRESIIGLKWINFIPEQLLAKMKKNHRMRRIDPSLAPDRYKTQVITTQGQRREGLLEVSMIPGSAKSVATFMDMTDFTKIDRALSSISAVNIAMIKARSERELLDTICKMIVKKCGYCFAWVGYIKGNEVKKVEVISSAGYDRGYTDKLDIALNDPLRSNGPTGQAIKTSKSIVCKNFKTDPKVAYWAPDAIERGYITSIAIPLKNQGQVFGVLNIYSNETNVFNQEEVKLLSDMTNNLAFAIVSLQTRENLKGTNEKLEQSLDKMHRILLQSVTSLGNVIGIRDPYTAGHQKKVARMAVAIAHELLLPKDKIDSIEVASSLHDIGKLSIPGEILNKPGGLTPLELEMIKTHPQAGYAIIRDIEFPWPIADIVLQHHERMDGTGYPHGLSGDEIMLEARIIAVADVMDSMATHRPFRAALGIKKALSEIENNKGKLFDAKVVDSCLHLFKEGRYRF